MAERAHAPRGGEQVAVFDLDGVLLEGYTLFDAALFAENDLTYFSSNPNGNLPEPHLDWLRREILADIAEQEGPDSKEYLEHAIRYFLATYAGELTPTQVTELAKTSRFWPNEASYYTFPRWLAKAWRIVGGQPGEPHRTLHCITFSPEFLATELLQKQGVPLGRLARIGFDRVNGSTYVTNSKGILSGQAYTTDKVETFRTVHGPHATPELVIGDGISERGLLGMAAIALAFNPKEDLREAAHEEGFTVVTEQDGKITIEVPHKRVQHIRTIDLTDMEPDKIIALVR